MKKIQNLIKARNALRIKKIKENRYRYARIKEYKGKVAPGTLNRILEELPNTIYQPDLRKMEEKNFVIAKKKLPASLIYETIHNLKPSLKNDLYEIGKALHFQFERLFECEDIITKFPTGISTNDFYWLTARPDAIIGSDKGNFLVELKTLTKKEFDSYSILDQQHKNLPDSILYQIRLYLQMFSVEKCFLCLYCIETERTKIITICSSKEDFDFFRNTFKIFIKKFAQSEGIPFRKIGKKLFTIKKKNLENKLKSFKGNFPYNKIKQHLKETFKNMFVQKCFIKKEGYTELQNKEKNKYMENQDRIEKKMIYRQKRIQKRRNDGYW